MSTDTKPRVCRSCGGPIGSTSRHAVQCGNCGRKRSSLAQMGMHQYARTHVHEHADGRKTIELGTTCRCDEEGTG